METVQSRCCSWCCLFGEPLQWGHRLSAMETTCQFNAAGPVCCLFAVPLQWGHRLSAMEMTIVQAEVGRGYELQWGHRLSAMETSKSGRARNITSSGFNGATAFRRWKRRDSNRSQKSPPLLGRRASMGPPPFGDGNRTGPLRLMRQARKASMGPPPFGDGNWQLNPEEHRAWLLLQWGHRLSAMETRGYRRTPVARPGSFNGATAFRRWKRARLLGAHQRPHAASMGPPPFGDGNVLGGLGRRASCCRLQWGHRLSAMETRWVVI